MLWTYLVKASAGLRVALVGGAVRDLLLHREHRDAWRGLVDLDFVVEAGARHLAPGSLFNISPAQQLLQLLQNQPGVELIRSRTHDAFGTVEVLLRLEGSVLMLDLASARREHYPEAAGSPQVMLGTIEDDLMRRDFTVNAMAISFGPGGDGSILIDPYGGRHDLCQRQLRFLHSNSLRDDPTRLIRAARYAARLGFNLSPEAIRLVESALNSWPWHWRAGDSLESAPASFGPRMRMEFQILLQREPWPAAIQLLQAWGGLRLLDGQLQLDCGWRRRLRWGAKLGLPPMATLLAGAADPLSLARRLQIPRSEQQLIRQWLLLRSRLIRCLRKETVSQTSEWKPSTWASFLEDAGLSHKAVALALACGAQPRRPLLRWLLRWRNLKSPLSAAELMDVEGLSPGPSLGRRLAECRAQLLDRETH